MINKEIFDAFGEKRLKELLKQGEKPEVIAGFLDAFGDSKITLCSKCGNPVYVRPYVYQGIQQYNLKVTCLCCADLPTVKGQVVMDFAKIEEWIK